MVDDTHGIDRISITGVCWMKYENSRRGSASSKGPTSTKIERRWNCCLCEHVTTCLLDTLGFFRKVITNNGQVSNCFDQAIKRTEQDNNTTALNIGFSWNW
jgi:hypothetical protein